MKRKLLLFAAAMLLVVAGYAQTASGTCGTNLTWTFEEATGTLTINGTGAMTDYSRSNPPWSVYKTLIANVAISNGVTSIGYYVFVECTKLTSITIPESVIIIFHGAFAGCTSLINITFGNSLSIIGDYAFFGCSNLTGITIPESVTRIGHYAFDGCHNLTSVAIPESATWIGRAVFANCNNLTAINVAVNNINYTSVNGILFDKLKTVLLQYPNGKADSGYTISESVTTIADGAFMGCSSLTSITIPQSVLSIEAGAFYGCTGLTSLTIPNSVTLIGDYAFYGCNKLAGALTIPPSVTTIADGAFMGCTAITTVNFNATNCTSMGPRERVFSDCTALCAVNIGDNVMKIPWSAFSSCSSLTNITIPEDVTSIDSWAFAYCPVLTSVTVNWQTPLVISPSVFAGSDVSKTKLIVPSGTAAAYRSAAVWQDFLIEESNSIENISFDDPIISTQYYTLQGVAVKYPQAGQIYIVKETRQSGKVTISKLIN